MEKLYIKNMVCDRCIRTVEKILAQHEVLESKVELGEVELANPITLPVKDSIAKSLEAEGFVMIESLTPVLVTKIKMALVSLFGKNNIPEEFKLSTYLTQKFPYDYSHLSRVFSNHEKDTIEHYLIRLRIEKAKELLTYNELNVSEVAYKLGYSSAAHFSRQFKKMVGITPSLFQKEPSGRKSLEDI